MPCDNQRDGAVFGGRDIRKEFGGPGVTKTAGTGMMCSAKFNKPPRRPSGGGGVIIVDSTGNCGGANGDASGVENVEALVGGEKEKSTRRRSSDESTPNGPGCSGANSEVDVSTNASLYLPPNKLERLCKDLGKSKGSETCSNCVGICCGYMRDIINVLVDFKEAVPNQEVCLVCLCFHLCS